MRPGCTRLHPALQPCVSTSASSRLTNASADHGDNGDSCFLIHTDMLHEAPLCMGIAHDSAAISRGPEGGTEYRNVYWAFDGGHRQLVRFDFESDHGPGSMDHSLANVRPCPTRTLNTVPEPNLNLDPNPNPDPKPGAPVRGPRAGLRRGHDLAHGARRELARALRRRHG